MQNGKKGVLTLDLFLPTLLYARYSMKKNCSPNDYNVYNFLLPYTE